MGGLLTTASTLMCPHGGTVTIVASGAQVSLGGNPLVVSTDTFTVAACAFSPGSPHPCVQVEWQLTNQASTAGSNATLSTDSVGMCKAADGAVQGTVLIQATQTAVTGR